MGFRGALTLGHAYLVRQHEPEKFERRIEYLDDLEGSKNVFMVGVCVPHIAYNRTFFMVSKSAKIMEIDPFSE